MTPAQVRQAVETGIEIARDLVAAGNRCLLTGDMGITNTTANSEPRWRHNRDALTTGYNPRWRPPVTASAGRTKGRDARP